MTIGALGRFVAHSHRAVIGHQGSLLLRRFDTSESRGVRADLSAGVGRSWSVGLAPLGASAPLEQSPAERPAVKWGHSAYAIATTMPNAPRA